VLLENYLDPQAEASLVRGVAHKACGRQRRAPGEALRGRSHAERETDKTSARVSRNPHSG
jgi:hypothetical protein